MHSQGCGKLGRELGIVVHERFLVSGVRAADLADWCCGQLTRQLTSARWIARD
ncbi:hypothetical protein ACS15_1579 [Ralstonia insidiosa]|uniref:Uncharacterized protein n=1 Tax=Ralstonia insidiosa TaxID=190721 RepID=A0AAC9BDC6_9RALS|nr:hypothetical protein ACS15_1579 [Ralstonia insidiosa]